MESAEQEKSKQLTLLSVREAIKSRASAAATRCGGAEMQGLWRCCEWWRAAAEVEELAEEGKPPTLPVGALKGKRLGGAPPAPPLPPSMPPSSLARCCFRLFGFARCSNFSGARTNIKSDWKCNKIEFDNYVCVLIKNSEVVSQNS